MNREDASQTSSGPTVGASPPAGKRKRRFAKVARGTSVGDRYLVLDELGRGGMAVVYRAYDPELDRRIALKLIHQRDPEARASQRLLREAQALAQLSHPNVVAVYDVGTYGSSVFMAMELVEGTTLRRWLRKAARTPNEILDVFLTAGEGLAAAHRAGTIHRDFKPENVLIGTDGRVRVADFGLARSLAPGASAEVADAGSEPAPATVEGDLAEAGAESKVAATVSDMGADDAGEPDDAGGPDDAGDIDSYDVGETEAAPAAAE